MEEEGEGIRRGPYQGPRWSEEAGLGRTCKSVVAPEYASSRFPDLEVKMRFGGK